MGAAFLDSELENLLRSIVVDNPSVTNYIFGQSCPISSFSARIDLSYLLGLISPSVRRDLHLVRKIRNDFAHMHHPATFELPAIASRCRELAHHFVAENQSPRRYYESTVIAVLATIHAVKPARATERKDIDLERAREKHIQALDQLLSDLNAASKNRAASEG